MTTVNGAGTSPVMTGATEVLASQLSHATAEAKKAAGVAPGEAKPTVNRNAITLDPAASGKSSDDFMLLLMTLEQELGRNKLLNAKKDIELSKTRHEQEHTKNIDKLKESQKKAQEAEKAGLAKKIFGWVATALSVIVAAIVTVATFGAGAGVGAMICAGVVLATVLASAAIQAANEVQVEVDGVKMGAFTAALYQAAKNNMSDDKAKDCATYSTLAIQLALAIIGAVASMGTSAVSSLGTTVNQVKNVTALASGAATVGSGASGIAAGVKNHEASEAQVDRLKLKAIMKQLQAQTDKTKDKIKNIMDEMQSLFQMILEMMNSNADSSTRMTKRAMI